MIAVDTSTWIAFLSGQAGRDVDLLEYALREGAVALPPVVVTELLSDPEAAPKIEGALLQLPQLSLAAGFGERAGTLRSKVLRAKRKARLADTLIAQSCIDATVPLLTRDEDFRHFARWGGLQLI